MSRNLFYFTLVLISLIVWQYNTYSDVKEIAIDFRELNGDLSETEVLHRFGTLDLKCGTEETNTMGERYCYAYIDQVNGLDANMIAFFFEKDKLTQMKVDLKKNAHENALRYCLQEYGSVSKVKKPKIGEQLVAWVFKDGMLVTSKEKSEGQNMLLWLSSHKMFQIFLN